MGEFCKLSLGACVASAYIILFSTGSGDVSYGISASEVLENPCDPWTLLAQEDVQYLQ